MGWDGIGYGAVAFGFKTHLHSRQSMPKDNYKIEPNIIEIYLKLSLTSTGCPSNPGESLPVVIAVAHNGAGASAGVKHSLPAPTAAAAIRRFVPTSDLDLTPDFIFRHSFHLISYLLPFTIRSPFSHCLGVVCQLSKSAPKTPKRVPHLTLRSLLTALEKPTQ